MWEGRLLVKAFARRVDAYDVLATTSSLNFFHSEGPCGSLVVKVFAHHHEDRGSTCGYNV